MRSLQLRPFCMGSRGASSRWARQINVSTTIAAHPHNVGPEVPGATGATGNPATTDVELDQGCTTPPSPALGLLSGGPATASGLVAGATIRSRREDCDQIGSHIAASCPATPTSWPIFRLESEPSKARPPQILVIYKRECLWLPATGGGPATRTGPGLERGSPDRQVLDPEVARWPRRSTVRRVYIDIQEWLGRGAGRGEAEGEAHTTAGGTRPLPVALQGGYGGVYAGSASSVNPGPISGGRE